MLITACCDLVGRRVGGGGSGGLQLSLRTTEYPVIESNISCDLSMLFTYITAECKLKRITRKLAYL